MKRMRRNWFSWYFLDPVINAVLSIGAWVTDTFWCPVADWVDERLGKWHCEYCGKRHTGRTWAFQLSYRKSIAHEHWAAAPATHESTRMCCSKGLDALREYMWEPEPPSELVKTVEAAILAAGTASDSLAKLAWAIDDSKAATMKSLGYEEFIILLGGVDPGRQEKP